MNLLEAKNISKSFPLEGGIFRRKLGAVRALHDVSFSLKKGESIGLVGESGSGKTTLGRILTGLLNFDRGELLWEGLPLNKMPARSRAGCVQMVFQDPASSLNPKLSVETHLSEPLLIRSQIEGKERPGRDKIRADIIDLFRVVGLPTDIFLDYPHQFSGGQKQRLAIARALAMRPLLLVADEPVSSLDLSIQAQILNLLKDMKKHFQLTTIIVSHDLAVVSYLADRLLVLKDGEIVEQGPTPQVLSSPKHPYTKTLLSAVPDILK